MEVKQPGKLYKILSTVSIVGLFITIGLLFTGLIEGYLGPGGVLVLSIFTIIFAGCMLSLVWLKNIENKQYKKTSIVFLAFTVLCCLLWIAAAIVIYIMLKQAEKDPNYNPINLLRLVKVAFIVSVQFVVANIIARNLIKHKKTHIAFQIIMYISCLFVDFYVTMFAIGLKFNPIEGMELTKSIRSVLFSGGMIATLVLFVVYIAIANSVINGIQSKRNGGEKVTNTRRRGLLGSMVDTIENIQLDEIFSDNFGGVQEKVEEVPQEVKEAAPEAEEDPQERLTKIKQLYDSGLITEEEFNAKKKEILEDM